LPTLQQLREYQKTIADFNEAIRLNPDNAEAYKYRGISYAILDEDDQASFDLYKAADLYQQQGDIEGYQEILSIIEDWNL
jgi:Flp pilus assembly protein TadD